MSFNELSSVEHFIIQKLSGVNLNVAGLTSSVMQRKTRPATVPTHGNTALPPN
ncbi:MAG: hypothetical protein ACO3RV_08905 [Luteolibacter sp.]